MFNWTEEKCFTCKKPFLMSIDEKEVFAFGYCQTCIDPRVKHIRAKIVMGFYDIDTINAEIVNKFVEKQVNLMERRKYPRIEVKDGKFID